MRGLCPLYPLEVKLVSARNQAIAEELETAAAPLLPEPQAGMTVYAPWYFAPVVDVIGGASRPESREVPEKSGSSIWEMSYGG